MKKLLLLFSGCIMFASAALAGDRIAEELSKLPFEMAIIEPVEIENVSIWVPAVKSGPFINRSCLPKQGLMKLSVLPATVDHRKEENCPPSVARILAEIVSVHHEKVLPLTIFNGWQWEYSYSLCQYDETLYTLLQRGGSWENCHEAILNISIGQAILSWLEVGPIKMDILDVKKLKSNAYVHVFTSMRTRNGYPKKRSL